MEGAYLIRGGASILPALEAHLAARGISVSANPDCIVREYASFGIDDALDIRARASLKGLASSRVFVLCAPALTIEAQNALLKTFEEPPAGAAFFLVVPSPGSLLPTLRSRMQELAPTGVSKRSGASEFLAAPVSERLSMVARFLADKKEGEERDLSGALTLLAGVEEELFARRAAESADGRRGIRAVMTARRYLSDKGSLMKALLEEVALLVPRV